ncbi:MAG: PD40 domain-containing protein [Planctomycetia bacterium]|nr:PD40 domain-containing protein [Planctomycetia bacterium]
MVASVLLTAADCARAAEPRRLTSDGRLKFTPVFLGDGFEIAYSVHDVPNRLTVMRLKVADGSQTRMFPETEQHLLDLTMSRNGRYVVFGRAATSPQLPLVIKDTVANTEAVYNPQEARAGVRSPTISPDGTRVVFGQSAPGGQQIASVDMKAGDLTFLTRAAGINTHPHYSPDGKQIAFSSSREGDFEIYVMQADGADVRRLTTSFGMDSHPHWSPDGKRIAFTSRRDGNYEIYVMNADGTGPVNLTRHPERDDFAAWHPSGKQIVTVSERNGDYDLYLFDVPEPS